MGVGRTGYGTSKAAVIGLTRQMAVELAEHGVTANAIAPGKRPLSSMSPTIVTRDDGSKMWALKGKPLYTFAKDTKPGDTTGDGFLNGAWHIAKP